MTQTSSGAKLTIDNAKSGETKRLTQVSLRAGSLRGNCSPSPRRARGEPARRPTQGYTCFNNLSDIMTATDAQVHGLCRGRAIQVHVMQDNLIPVSPGAELRNFPHKTRYFPFRRRREISRTRLRNSVITSNLYNTLC